MLTGARSVLQQNMMPFRLPELIDTFFFNLSTKKGRKGKTENFKVNGKFLDDLVIQPTSSERD